MARRSLQVEKLVKLIAYQNSLDMQLKHLKTHFQNWSPSNEKVIIKEMNKLKTELDQICGHVRRLANKLHVKLLD